MKAVTVDEALHLWNEVLEIQHHRMESVAVSAAKGSVLAEDIVASTDVPAFHKSAMDGYALAYDPNCGEYIIDGIIGAGVVWDTPVTTGHAVRIMTGAPVPETCDTVIMQEQAQGSGEIGSRITIQGTQQKGSHIIPRGEECLAGTVVIPKGTEVTSAVQTILTGLGYIDVSVYAMPRILVLTSGHEVIEPGEPLTTGKIYNSNRMMICSLLDDLGFRHVTQYHVSDAPDRLDVEIARVLELSEQADIIISSGGVSVGMFDTMPLIYEKLGAKTLYERIQMRPGAASYGAVTPKGQLIFGLSGNPGAAFNGWHLLVVPTLRRYKGIKNWSTPVLNCVMDCDLSKRNAFDRYVQGKVIFGDGQPRFVANRHFNSSSMLGLYTVNALACIPQGVHEVHEGDIFKVYLLGILPTI